MKKILLICSAGASSGFMAKNIRVAAAARGLDFDVFARSDSMLEDYLDDIDFLLVSPHLDFMLDEIKDLVNKKNIPVSLIPKNLFGSLNGAGVLEIILEKLGGENNE